VHGDPFDFGVTFSVWSRSRLGDHQRRGLERGILIMVGVTPSDLPFIVIVAPAGVELTLTGRSAWPARPELRALGVA